MNLLFSTTAAVQPKIPLYVRERRRQRAENKIICCQAFSPSERTPSLVGSMKVSSVATYQYSISNDDELSYYFMSTQFCFTLDATLFSFSTQNADEIFEQLAYSDCLNLAFTVRSLRPKRRTTPKK
jgi:hypothetical protein